VPHSRPSPHPAQITDGGGVPGTVVVVAATGLARMGEFNRSVEDFASVRVPKLIASEKWAESLLVSSRHTRNILILGDEKRIKAEIDLIRKNQRNGKELLEQAGLKLRLKDAGQASLGRVAWDQDGKHIACVRYDLNPA
jgi:hypothetical protein